VTVEYSGFYNGDTAADLDNTGFTLGTDYTQGDDVGTYNTTIAIGTATDNNYDFTPLLTSTFEVDPATITILYIGDQTVILGNSFIPKAQITGPNAASITNIKICFLLDTNPTTGNVEEYPLGYGFTNSSGIVTIGFAPDGTPITSISTSGWQGGVYTIIAKECDPNVTGIADEATLTVADPGAAATGGGWYTLNGNGRINFGFTVRLEPNTIDTYRGQILLINKGAWRLKGTLDKYVSILPSGSASGTGKLYRWDKTLNVGLGGWALASDNVPFTISFTDTYNGTSNNKKAVVYDTFGIHINYVIALGDAPLPNFSPITLKGGNIDIKSPNNTTDQNPTTPPPTGKGKNR